MARIIGAGNITIDRIAEVSNIPAINEAAFIKDTHIKPGGSSANTIACLQNFGHDTGLIAKVGGDGTTDEIVEEMESRGIDCSYVEFSEDDETSYTHIYTNSSGDQIILAGGEGLAGFRLDDTQRGYVQTAEYLHTSGYTAPHVLEGLIHAKTDESHLSFDLATTFKDFSSRGYSRDLIDNALDEIDLFVSQKSALLSYTDTEDIEAAVSHILAEGIGKLAITLGTDGSVLITREERTHVDAYDVDVVDTTGAGDAFVAGLIHSWVINQDEMEEAGKFANATAALNCREFGGQGGIPSLEEVHELVGED